MWRVFNWPLLSLDGGDQEVRRDGQSLYALVDRLEKQCTEVRSLILMMKIPAVVLGIDLKVGDEAFDKLASVITLYTEPLKEVGVAIFRKRLAKVVIEPLL